MSRDIPKGQENPFKDQVGGDHYTSMGMQPFEFTFPNGYDGIAHTIFKYIARHKTKGQAEDLKKAIHCVKLRATDLHKNPLGVPAKAIPLKAFISQNPQLATMDINALYKLEHWLLHPEREDLPLELARTLTSLIIHTYATDEEE